MYLSYIQSNKNNDINNQVLPRKRKKSYSDEELDESSKNNLEDDFIGYLKDSSGKSIKNSMRKNFETDKKKELLNDNKNINSI